MEGGKPIFRFLPLAALLALLIYHGATNLWFIRLDNRPANINELSHVIGAIDYLNWFLDSESKYSAYLQAFNGYPPAGMAATAAYALLGRDHESAQKSQLLFSVALMLGLLGIGKRLFDERTGLLAVFLCVTAPASCEVSRQYLLEWPLTAATVMAAWFLLLSEGFLVRRYAILAGIFVGLSAMCKQTFLIFLAGPLVYSAGQWIVTIRQGRVDPSRPPKRIRTLIGLPLTLAGSVLLARGIYSPANRQAIDNWINAASGMNHPWGLIFLIATAAILATGLCLLWLRSTPIRNAISAGLIALFIAGLWYFPKGITNFLEYRGQMVLNVEKSRMTPGSLLHFYYEHIKTYYLGPALLYLVLAGVLLWVFVFLLHPYLKRHFFLKGMLPDGGSLLFVLLWLGFPAVAFFFITIQNEMNNVPLLPPLYLFCAAVLARLRLIYSPKTLHRFQQGKWTAGPRVMKFLFGFLSLVLIAGVLVNGFVTSFIFKQGDRYVPIPGNFDEITARHLMHRKFNDINYLVPWPGQWHEKEITRAMISASGPDTPRILIMDVDFYFSWNTFWYLFKLAHHNVEIQTQWYDDRDLLAESNGEIPLYRYDMILYRQPWKELYAGAYNDYLEYKNLWKTFEFLSDPSPAFSGLYRPGGNWRLMNGSQAILLVRNSPVSPAVQ